MKLQLADLKNINRAIEIIDNAKEHLKEQGIDQWQNGYPNYSSIETDIINQKGYFVVEENNIVGYLCIDFNGEPAYDSLKGSWHSDEKYVVVHRLAFANAFRGKGVANQVFELVCTLCLEKDIRNFRVDTDEGNTKMQHILKKNGFQYCGTIWFDNSEKIAFDKIIK